LLFHKTIKSKCRSGRAQHASPNSIKKETWVAGKQEGGAGRQSVVPAARLLVGTVVSRLVAGQEARPSSQSKLE
jgi:hypothetical protein